MTGRVASAAAEPDASPEYSPDASLAGEVDA